MPPTSQATNPSRAGFLLIEVLVALTVLVLLAAIVLPRLIESTGSGRLRASAMAVASVLRDDRAAAMRSGAIVVTDVDLNSRAVTSGSERTAVALPSDVDLRIVFAAPESSPRVRFFPNGSSSGAELTLASPSSAIDIRVDWFTGAVKVMAPHAP